MFDITKALRQAGFCATAWGDAWGKPLWCQRRLGHDGPHSPEKDW